MRLRSDEKDLTGFPGYFIPVLPEPVQHFFVRAGDPGIGAPMDEGSHLLLGKFLHAGARHRHARVRGQGKRDLVVGVEGIGDPDAVMADPDGRLPELKLPLHRPVVQSGKRRVHVPQGEVATPRDDLYRRDLLDLLEGRHDLLLCRQKPSLFVIRWEDRRRRFSLRKTSSTRLLSPQFPFCFNSTGRGPGIRPAGGTAGFFNKTMVYIFLDTGFPVGVEMEHRFYRIELVLGERGWSGGISATLRRGRFSEEHG